MQIATETGSIAGQIAIYSGETTGIANGSSVFAATCCTSEFLASIVGDLHVSYVK